jgi:phage-related holin
VVQNLLNNRSIARFITQEQVENIFKQDNAYLLETLEKSVDDFQSCNVCKIIDKFINHPNARVRGSVLSYINNLSLQQLELLSNDSDMEIASEAKKLLKDKKS